MRVLVVGLSRFGVPTGICRYTDVLSRTLATVKGTEVTVAVGAWQYRYFRDIFKTHRHSRLLPVEVANGSWSRNAWYTLRLPQISRKMKADIVHFAYPVPFLRGLGCPAVVTVHDLYQFEVPGNFKLPLANRVFFRWCLNRCKAVVCVSQTTLHRLQIFCPELAGRPGILTQIYTPVATPQINDDQQPIAGLTPSQFILSVAQHRQNKNLDLLQQAFAALRSAGKLPSDWKLVIVGSEDRKTTELHALTAGLGLTEHVLYLSSITDSDLAWLYHHAALAAFPSSHEGFCLPLVEALSTGLRVVCSNIPTLKEIGGESCTYFNLGPEAVGSLGQAITDALSRRPPIAPGATSPYGFPVAATQLLQLYNSVRYNKPTEQNVFTGGLENKEEIGSL
jgi:glycosyltransferase involved in cell wall biosynthesis